MTKNPFLVAAHRNDTVTENGATSNSSTGSNFADQMGKAANYRGRNFTDVANDQSLLWDENPTYAIRFPFYLRMITRKTKVNKDFTTETVMKGQGARDEAFKRLLWIAREHPTDFYNCIWLLPIVGRWKDLFELLFLDKSLGINAINHEVIFALVMQGLAMPEHTELVKKYLPRIRSNQKCTTEWATISNGFAKEFAKMANMTYREYNKMKATIDGWQQKMCDGRYDEINFSTIPGKALSKIVCGKFLKKHGLAEKYAKWMEKKDTVHFTGYVYELGQMFERGVSTAQRETINKMFKTLVEKATADDKITSNVWVAVDTSGSMESPVHGKVRALDICKSLAVFFSTINKGAFHKNIIMFDDTSNIKELSGEFCDMMSQIPYDAMGGTNFQSVVEEIVRVRKANPNIALEDYPNTLLVVSDMQFNPTIRNWRTYYWDSTHATTREPNNYEKAKETLATAFPKEWVDKFKFVWWDCTSRCPDFPAQITDGGCYFLSGFDPSIINVLLGETVNKNGSTTISMEEVIERALNQEILALVKAEQP